VQKRTKAEVLRSLVVVKGGLNDGLLGVVRCYSSKELTCGTVDAPIGVNFLLVDALVKHEIVHAFMYDTL